MKQDFQLLYVYIVRCSDLSYYVGVTNDLERRIFEHNEGLSDGSYTKRRRPVTLVYWQEFTEKQAAFDWESQIKGWSRAKKKALIDADWNRIIELAKKKKLE